MAGASGSAVAVGTSDTWGVRVDGMGTADPVDDVVAVSATSASDSGIISTRFSIISNALLDQSCRSNPFLSTTRITDARGGSLLPEIIDIKFHSACDGMVEVNGTTQPSQLRQ